MSTAEWISTSADVFASLGTVGAFATGMILFRREHQREESLAEEARRDQAVKVSAWIEATRTSSGAPELHFHVHNASQMPIYEVSVRNPVADSEPDEAEFIGLVPPGQTIRRLAPREWLATYHSPRTGRDRVPRQPRPTLDPRRTRHAQLSSITG